MQFIFLIFLSIITSVSALNVQAAETPLGLVTGPQTGTYIAIGRDIAKIGSEVNVPVEVKESGGSIDNIKRINSKENAALGIVQSDVLGFLSRSRNAETMKMAAHLRLVLPLYKEEVHVLARKSIHSLSDLKGKKVVLGEEGSGHLLTAVNLLSLLDIKVAETIRLSAPEGVVAVLQGDADAVVFVGGKPVRLFENLGKLGSPENAKYTGLLKNVHFVPIKDTRILEEYQVAEITHADYDFVTEQVPTIAINAVLMSFDFDKGDSRQARTRCGQIGRLADQLRAELSTLKETGHPKWKEVDFSQDVSLWRKDPCAWHETTPGTRPALDRDLLKIIDKSEIHK